MIMEGQSRRLATPLNWGRREKTIVTTLLAIVAIALIALVIYGATSGSPARADCVDVTFASTLGGARLKACGGRARRVCASGSFRGIEDELRAACRHAGFPYTPAR